MNEEQNYRVFIYMNQDGMYYKFRGDEILTSIILSRENSTGCGRGVFHLFSSPLMEVENERI